MPKALTGRPCDAVHPFPVPPDGAWTSSSEYGAEMRSSTEGPNAAADVDPSPTWRAMAAWIWDAPCVQDHASEIADDTALTTHLLAAAMVPRVSMNALEGMTFSPLGTNLAIDALRQGKGLVPVHAAVQAMPVDSRRKLIRECLSLVLEGYTNLQIDLEAYYLRRRPHPQ